MLSRTAGALYWTGRYLERADFVARLLDASQRFGAIPAAELGLDDGPWTSALKTAGAIASFAAVGEPPTGGAVTRHLTLSRAHPSSILECVEKARANARATRTCLTTETWTAINDLRHDARRVAGASVGAADLADFLERVKAAILLYNGALQRTQLRDESYYFLTLGGAVERADNTARLVDVKYHLLLPHGEEVGGGLDYFHWSTILRTVGAATAYHWVYRTELKPWLVADLLLLNRRMPRSLAASIELASRELDALSARSGRRGPAHRMAASLALRLADADIDTIFARGLHEFVVAFIAENNALGAAIAEQYGF
jgi:uncharacterized alpha-E superfamily protein